jgi:hypothetical protein
VEVHVMGAGHPELPAALALGGLSHEKEGHDGHRGKAYAHRSHRDTGSEPFATQ